VFEAYVAASRDRAPAELRAFYESYRACVRAKVAALRLAQQAPHEAKATWSELRRDLETAAVALSGFGKPTLYVMRGLMGTGKSTLAAAVAEALAIERLRTDEIRCELFGPATSANDFDCGTYGPAQRRQVYKELARRCRLALSRGMSIVADGTFLTAEELATARGAAEASGAELRIVECRCPAEVAKARIARRLAEGRDPSEARPELYDRQAAAAFDSCEGYDIVVVDTTLPPEARLAAALRRS
jgi:predicted kinase